MLCCLNSAPHRQAHTMLCYSRGGGRCESKNQQKSGKREEGIRQMPSDANVFPLDWSIIQCDKDSRMALCRYIYIYIHIHIIFYSWK